MSYTQGPWTLAEANSTIPIKGANGKTVASVRYGETDLPDARLIAAAPELLAALQVCAEWIAANTEDIEPLRQARQAIKSAIGE